MAAEVAESVVRIAERQVVVGGVVADGDVVAEADDDGAADITIDQVVFDEGGGAIDSGGGALEGVAEVIELDADTDTEIGAARLGADDAVIFEGFVAANDDMEAGGLIEGDRLVEGDAARLREVLLAVAEESVAFDGEVIERKGADAVARAVMDIVFQDTHAIAGDNDPAPVAIRNVEAGEREIGAQDADLADDFGGTAGGRSKRDGGGGRTGTEQRHGLGVGPGRDRHGVARSGGQKRRARDISERSSRGEAVVVIVAVCRDEVVRGAEG